MVDFNKLAKEIYEDSKEGLTDYGSSSNASNRVLSKNSIIALGSSEDSKWSAWNKEWLSKRNTYLERFGKAPPLNIEILILEITLREHFER